MKRLATRDELILDDPALLVRHQRTVFLGKLFTKLIEPSRHGLRRSSRVGVVDSHFVKPPMEELPFHGRGRRIGQETGSRGDFKHPQSGLISGDKYIKIQRMFGRPRYQSFRGIAPVQAKRRLQDRLRKQPLPCEADQKRECGKSLEHTRNIRPTAAFRKPGRWKRGFALVEATMAMSMLSVVGLILLKLSLNIIHPRQYTLQQVLSDAYLTQERAEAERIPFETLTANGSKWPSFPTVSTQSVVIGKLPGGVSVTGTIHRTRIPDPGNYPIDGGTGTVATNPAAMRVWRVQSILRYQISGRNYVKSRTVARAQ
jgi:type II secretory pathway pseudopilin PulG